MKRTNASSHKLGYAVVLLKSKNQMSSGEFNSKVEREISRCSIQSAAGRPDKARRRSACRHTPTGATVYRSGPRPGATTAPAGYLPVRDRPLDAGQHVLGRV